MTNSSVKTNFIFNVLYQLSGILVPIVTLPYLSRTLQADGMGEYSFAYSVSYYFYIFIRLGLHNYGNRTIAYVRDDANVLSKTFWDIYAFQFLWGAFVSIVYLVYCFFYAPITLLALVFFLVVVSGAVDLSWVLYGLEEFRIASVRDLLIKILTTVSIFFFVKEKGDVWKYALIYSSGFLIAQLLSVVIVAKKIRFVRPRLNDVISHIKPNFILFLPTVAVSVYKTMDKIMLGTMTGEEELGYYHSSENIIMVPLALITALGTVMLPRMSNLFSKGDVGKKEAKEMFDNSMVFAMFISTSICVGIMTVSREFVPLFFGSGFEKCIMIFQVLLPSCIFLAFANVIRTQYLLPKHKDFIFVSSLFTGAVTNVMLNLILIPRYASIGASVGTLAAEIVVCVYQSIAVYKELDLGKNIVASIPFICSGIAMYCLFYTYTPGSLGGWLALIVKIVVCGLFYLIVLAAILGVLKLISNRSKMGINKQ